MKVNIDFYFYVFLTWHRHGTEGRTLRVSTFYSRFLLVLPIEIENVPGHVHSFLKRILKHGGFGICTMEFVRDFVCSPFIWVHNACGVRYAWSISWINLNITFETDFYLSILKMYRLSFYFNFKAEFWDINVVLQAFFII